MLLLLSTSMSRRVLALAVILVAAGLAPATSVLGFCAKMPCCISDSAERGAPVLDAPIAGCCTAINCYDAPSHELTVSGKTQILTGSGPAVLPVVGAPVPAPAVRRLFFDISPPPTTANRLASLSVLLI